MLSRLLLAAAIGFLAAPAAAGAATVSLVQVSVGDDKSGYKPADALRFEAAPGEANDVAGELVQRFDGPDVAVVRDRGASLEPGRGCAAFEGGVRCEARDIDGSSLRLGDGDDRSTFPAVDVDAGDGDDVIVAASNAHGGAGSDVLFGRALWGGPGDDRLDTSGEFCCASLHGEAGDDMLIGSPGGDGLDGGGGRDQLYGRGGDDYMTDGDDPAHADADVLDGGPGRHDRVWYGRRVRPLFVSIAGGPGQGEAGEGDVLSGFESITGGFGADRLVGSDRADELDGRGGADVVDGRGGNDVLLGGDGRDRLIGGRGNDLLISRHDYPARTDRISCGAGRDRVRRDRRDRVTADCERVRP